LTIAAKRDADFSVSAAKGTTILRAKSAGKAGLLWHALKMAFTGKGREYDIVLTEPSVLAFSGFFFRVLGAPRWVVDVWDIPIRCNLNRSFSLKLRCAFEQKLLGVLFKKADLFILSILPDFEFKKFGVPEHKIVALKNAIWPVSGKNTVDTVSGPLTLLCMRSVHTADMGLDVLAEAFVEVKRHLPDARLVLVGSITDDVRRQLEPLEGLDGFELTGFISHEALQEQMSNAHIFVVPFRDVPDLAQTYPIKVIEFMTEGKPVVASNIEGISRLIEHERTGLLYKADDPHDLARQVLRLADDANLGITLARQAVEAAKEYDCNQKGQVIYNTLADMIAHTPNKEGGDAVP